MANKSRAWKVAVMAVVALTAVAGCGANGQSATKDGKPVITVQVVKDARAVKMSEMEWTKDLEKACGCAIEWQDVAASSWDQQKQASLAAGEVADVTIGGFGSGDMGEYGSLFLDLKPELGSMPNVSKMFKTEPYSQVISTTTDGKILGTPSVARPVTARTSNHMFINKAWLDKLGLQPPTTWGSSRRCSRPSRRGTRTAMARPTKSPWTSTPPAPVVSACSSRMCCLRAPA